MNMGNNIHNIVQDNPVTTQSSTLARIDTVLERFRYLRNELASIDLQACEYNFNNAKLTHGIIKKIVERMDMCYEE